MAAVDTRENNHLAAPPQEDLYSIAAARIADLRRAFIAEAMRIAALKASHAADNVEIVDDAAAERAIAAAIAHLREGAAAFRELQREGGGAA